ncbi:hypothetical protein CMV_020515 [Castanea mollissima]|uniref:Uncharacterized protein n=1 Tax=Castanea mollissima TaxID=60419 RepID=A0A8J4QVT3_9ROSI|nr:hypothetical protein CMV_020515 [Castanea mollissima]
MGTRLYVWFSNLNMLTRRPTWKLNLDECIEDVWKQIASAIPSIPDGISHLAKDFLLRCFVRNPEERSSVGSLLYHPFVNVVLHDMPESEVVVLSSCAAASSDLEDKFKEEEVEEVYGDDIMEEDPSEIEIGNQVTPVGSSWASKEAVEAAGKLFNSVLVDNIIPLGSALV